MQSNAVLYINEQATAIRLLCELLAFGHYDITDAWFQVFNILEYVRYYRQ